MVHVALATGSEGLRMHCGDLGPRCDLDVCGAALEQDDEPVPAQHGLSEAQFKASRPQSLKASKEAFRALLRKHLDSFFIIFLRLQRCDERLRQRSSMGSCAGRT